MSTPKETGKAPAPFAAAEGSAAEGSAEHEWQDDDCGYDGPTCGMCGDDGWIMLSDGGPSEWGEDCFSEIDRPIECPECRDRRRHEAAMAKRQNAEVSDGGLLTHELPAAHTRLSLH